MKFLYKILNTLSPNEVNRLILRNSELVAENQTCANYLSQFQIDNSKVTKELNELLATKARLTAEVLKLREQLEEANNKVEVLEQLNLEYLATNEELMLKTKKLEDANFNIKHTIKHRLIGFLRDDLGIVLKPQDINYYDD